jgi:integrase
MTGMKYSSAFVRRNGGRWYGVLSFKEGARWRTASHRLDATNKQGATRELAAWRAEMEAQATAEDAEDSRASGTVAAYVDDYIDRMASSEAIEGATVIDYRATARRIAKAFPDVALRDLTPEAVQRWEAGMLRGGLSAATVGKAHRLLKQIMAEAVRLDILAKNPVDPVKPPKRRRAAPNALDLDGRTAVLSALDAMVDTPTTVGARIALYTGMREGEVCGLRWADVDIQADDAGRVAGGTITVRQSIGARTGGHYVKTPKTGCVRDVPMPADLAILLARWRRVQRTEAMAAGVTFPGQLYVTGRVDGSYQTPDMLSHEWHALSKAFGVRGTEGRIPTFHDLRHTFATCAIAEGVDVKTVSSILGHANAAMTLNVYASADPDAKRRAAVTINAAMRRRPATVEKFEQTGA